MRSLRIFLFCLLVSSLCVQLAVTQTNPNNTNSTNRSNSSNTTNATNTTNNGSSSTNNKTSNSTNQSSNGTNASTNTSGTNKTSNGTNQSSNGTNQSSNGTSASNNTSSTNKTSNGTNASNNTNGSSSGNVKPPPFNPAAYVAEHLSTSTISPNISGAARQALVDSIIRDVGLAANSTTNFTNNTLNEIIAKDVAYANQQISNSLSIPKNVTPSSSSSFILYHASALSDGTQHVMYALVINIALNATYQLINPAGYSVVWTCNSTTFFGTTLQYTSSDGTLVIPDLADRVRAGVVITFTATISNLSNSSQAAVVLKKTVQFSGSLAIISVTEQGDDTTTDQYNQTRRVVSFTLSPLPSFLSTSTQSPSSPPPPLITVTTQSLSYFYAANLQLAFNLSSTFQVKFPQPPQAVQILVTISIQGASTSVNASFTLNPTTNAANKPKPVNLAVVKPNTSNIGDVSSLISQTVATNIASNGTASSSASSSTQSDCTSQGGTWITYTSTSKYGFNGYCNRTFNATASSQIESLADTTLTLFNNNSDSFNITDQLSFVQTIGSARSNGCPLTSSTVSTALDVLTNVAQNISNTIDLSGSASSSTSLTTTIKGILQARSSLTLPDAQSIANNATNSSTKEAAMSNQRQSLSILDSVLSSFSTARTTIGSSLTVAIGADTIHSSDICLSNYANLSDSDLISLSIDPLDGAAANDPTITVTTKFGFYISKSTLRTILQDKTNSTDDCLNLGGTKTSKSTGACGHQGVENMTNEIIGFKIFDASGNPIDVTGYTLYLEIPCADFNVSTLNLTAANQTLSVQYLNTTSEIPVTGGSFIKLGVNNDTCIFSVNHLSSYALSTSSSSSSNSNNNSTSASAIRMELKSVIAGIIVLLGVLLFN